MAYIALLHEEEVADKVGKFTKAFLIPEMSLYCLFFWNWEINVKAAMRVSGRGLDPWLDA